MEVTKATRRTSRNWYIDTALATTNITLNVYAGTSVDTLVQTAAGRWSLIAVPMYSRLYLAKKSCPLMRLVSQRLSYRAREFHHRCILRRFAALHSAPRHTRRRRKFIAVQAPVRGNFFSPAYHLTDHLVAPKTPNSSVPHCIFGRVITLSQSAENRRFFQRRRFYRTHFDRRIQSR